MVQRRIDVKLIAWCMALLATAAGCGSAHPVSKPTQSTPAAKQATSAPPTTATPVAAEQHACTGAKPHGNGNPLDVRRLRKPTKLSHDQLLLYPVRDHDRPIVSAAAALHPHDGAGNSYPAVYGGVTPVLLLVRFTYVISVASPNRVVDRLAWVVISNCVLLLSNGPGPSPPISGYSLTVVDATTGAALMTVQTGPPLDTAHLGT